VPPTATINTVVSASCESTDPVLVTENRELLGVITHRALLLGIRGRSPNVTDQPPIE
jgi:hypothetical protein